MAMWIISLFIQMILKPRPFCVYIDGSANPSATNDETLLIS
jgi:hypothetical protein